MARLPEADKLQAEAAGGAIENGVLADGQREDDVARCRQRAGEFDDVVARLGLRQRRVGVAHRLGQTASEFRGGQPVVGIAGDGRGAGDDGVKRNAAGCESGGIARHCAGGWQRLYVVGGRGSEAQCAIGDLRQHTVDQHIAAVISPGQAATGRLPAAVERSRGNGIEHGIGRDFLGGLGLNDRVKRDGGIGHAYLVMLVVSG